MKTANPMIATAQVAKVFSWGLCIFRPCDQLTKCSQFQLIRFHLVPSLALARARTSSGDRSPGYPEIATFPPFENSCHDSSKTPFFLKLFDITIGIEFMILSVTIPGCLYKPKSISTMVPGDRFTGLILHTGYSGDINQSKGAVSIDLSFQGSGQE